MSTPSYSLSAISTLVTALVAAREEDALVLRDLVEAFADWIARDQHVIVVLEKEHDDHVQWNAATARTARSTLAAGISGSSETRSCGRNAAHSAVLRGCEFSD